jgi:energy-coupling factor transport system ATP-binding protein
VIRFEDVSFEYPDRGEHTLRNVDLVVPEGEMCLVVGATGTGKSTLLRATNGHVPRFTGGTLSGRVRVDGRSTAEWLPRDLADVVGVVGQDPAAGFVTDTVEDELAYAMENIGVPADAMRRRVEDVLDLLDLHLLRDRPLATLSGGQQQRVAIGSVLTANPRVLVLDEPTSALDPAAAEEVLAALTRLVHDLGITVLIAEHRLERVVQYADRMVLVPGAGERIHIGEPGVVLATSPIAPPVVQLGLLAGWSPVPLSIRDARRHAPGLRDRLDGAVPAPRRRVVGERVASVSGLAASYGPVQALRGIDLTLSRGEVVGVMGRNGAGKSTLLAHLVGLRAPTKGTVQIEGVSPHRLSARDVMRHVALVPQDAGLLLDAATVDAECHAADHGASRPAGSTRMLLDELVPGIGGDAHPRDLSEGQRLGLALAVVLVERPPLLLLDEPTRGLDYAAKRRLIDILDGLAQEGHSVVIATHDVEVVAAVADRVIVIADGDIVADGPARDVVTHSPVFAPQVSKVLAPLPWLTVDEVERALEGAA